MIQARYGPELLGKSMGPRVDRLFCLCGLPASGGTSSGFCLAVDPSPSDESLAETIRRLTSGRLGFIEQLVPGGIEHTMMPLPVAVLTEPHDGCHNLLSLTALWHVLPVMWRLGTLPHDS
jgi:hypothetical protein